MVWWGAQGGGRAAGLSSWAAKVLATFSLVATQRGGQGTNIGACINSRHGSQML